MARSAEKPVDSEDMYSRIKEPARSFEILFQRDLKVGTDDTWTMLNSTKIDSTSRMIRPEYKEFVSG